MMRFATHHRLSLNPLTMGRQRKKIYTRRERFQHTMRHTRLILLFLLIGILLLAWFRRHQIWDQLYPYFY